MHLNILSTLVFLATTLCIATEFLNSRTNDLARSAPFPFGFPEDKTTEGLPVSGGITPRASNSLKYLIRPKNREDKDATNSTEAMLKEVLQVQEIFTWHITNTSLGHWIINATDEQVEKIKKDPGVGRVTWNDPDCIQLHRVPMSSLDFDKELTARRLYHPERNVQYDRQLNPDYDLKVVSQPP